MFYLSAGAGLIKGEALDSIPTHQRQRDRPRGLEPSLWLTDWTPVLWRTQKNTQEEEEKHTLRDTDIHRHKRIEEETPADDSRGAENTKHTDQPHVFQSLEDKYIQLMSRGLLHHMQTSYRVHERSFVR